MRAHFQALLETLSDVIEPPPSVDGCLSQQFIGWDPHRWAQRAELNRKRKYVTEMKSEANLMKSKILELEHAVATE